jgi:hypothetical protein
LPLLVVLALWAVAAVRGNGRVAQRRLCFENVPAISVDEQSGNDFAVVSGVPKPLSEAGRHTLAVVTDAQTFHLSRCDRFLLLACHWT